MKNGGILIILLRFSRQCQLLFYFHVVSTTGMRDGKCLEYLSKKKKMRKSIKIRKTQTNEIFICLMLFFFFSADSLVSLHFSHLIFSSTQLISEIKYLVYSRYKVFLVFSSNSTHCH